MKFKFIAIERAAQFICDNDPLLNLTIKIGVVKAEAITAIRLGAIQCEIGLNHHLIGVADVGAQARNANAGGNVDLVAINHIGFRDQLADLAGQRAGRIKIIDVVL